MGLFDNTDWTDPANAAQMAFAANLMSSGKGLFPAYGDALKAAPGAAANAQAYRSNQIGIADNIAKLQTWMGKTNHFRRQAGMPDLTLDDLIKGNYSLLPDAQKQSALAAATGVAQPTSTAAGPSAAPASPLAPAASPDGVVPAQAGSSLFGDGGASVLPSLMATESGGNPNAVSPKGATGAMQVMPQTASDPGFGIAPSNGTPEDTKRVGDQYYQALEKKYGNPAYALVAYNWGPGNTDKWIKAGADPSKIPAETQGEIAKVALRMAQGGTAGPQGTPQNVDPTLAAKVQPSAGGVPQGPQSAIPSDLGLYAPDEAIANAEKQMTTLSPQQVAATGLPAGSFAQTDPFGKVDVNTFGAVSPEALKQQQEIWGVKSGMDALTGGVPGGVGSGSSAAQAPLLHGPEFLKTINPQLAATVKQIGDGKMTLASVASRMPGPMRLALTNMVTQYNPAFDETTMPMRRAAAISFGSGPDGKIIQSFNAMSAHIYSARPMLEALKNGNVPLFNQLAQEWAKQTGNPVPTNADMIKTLLGDEITKSILGYSNAEGDRKAMQAPFEKANSPAQLLGALDTAEEFAAGQLRAERQKYEHATKLPDFNDMLVPEAQAIFAAHQGTMAKSQKSSGGKPQAQALPDAARKQLRPGVITTFKVGNGVQKWTLDANNNPQQVP